VCRWSCVLALAGCSVEHGGLVARSDGGPTAPAPDPAPPLPPSPSPTSTPPVPDAGSPDASAPIVVAVDAPVAADTAPPAPDVAPPIIDDAPGACPPSADLSLCLTFEGLVTDESPRRTPVEGRPLGYASGPTGRAGTFASGGTVAVPRVDVLGPAGGTLEAWVRPGAIGKRMVIVDGPYRLSILGSGSAMCSTADGYALQSAATTAGVWTTLACTFTGDTIALFVDGRRVRQGALAGPVTRTARATIGQDLDAHFPVDGLIDNVRVWQAIRTDAQLCAASPACAASPPPGRL
jgi:hypothetical protein